MAKKVKSSFINMVLTLMVITVVASLALGSVYNLTLEPIAAAKKAARERAIKLVLPGFDSLNSFKVPISADAAIMAANGGEDSLEFHQAFEKGKYVGMAVSTFSNKGYDPTQIQIMVGFLPDGVIDSTVVTQQKETPGLGTKMADPKFNGQFAGQNPATFNLYVTKDGGQVDAITASTISSRAVCEALRRAYETFESYKTKGGNE
ncbi:MAG: RnfABCDGE type electron transport complex subunit G [Bacteroidales bacterium]|jgi:electron transport complex protein RnfG|nr:RnfABCDGE type electron transport complex subunit G [Bacteroidales bacterium]